MPIALNSGDALYTLVWKEMMDLSLEPKKQLELQKMYVEVFKNVVEGQGTELHWEINNYFDITEEQYLKMIDGKTSSLIGFSCQMGAYLGGADEKICRRFHRFGMKIGAAFQIHDDVLNVIGSFDKYKKEIGGDITEGKRTLMVVHCLKHCEPNVAKEIKRILGEHSREKGDINFVINAFKKHGSIDYAKHTAHRLIEEAESELEKLEDSEEKQALMAICDYIVSRES
jgi:geranylgeranyl pyrophosphate synthase